MTDLAAIGAALYGRQWRRPMAKALGVNLRTVQRWANGQNDVAPWVGAELLRLLAEHGMNLDDIDRIMGRE